MGVPRLDPVGEFQLGRFHDHARRHAVAALWQGLPGSGCRGGAFLQGNPRQGTDRAVPGDLLRTHYPEWPEHREPAPGQFPDPRGQEQGQRRRQQLRHGARADAVRAAHGAGQAGGRVFQSPDQAPDVHDRAAHPLCLVTRAQGFRGVFQVRLFIFLQGRGRLRVRRLPG